MVTILVLFILSVLVPMTLFGGITLYSAGGSIKNLITQRIVTQTKSDVAIFQNFVSSFGSVASYFANDTNVVSLAQDDNPNLQNAVFQEFDNTLKQYPSVMSIYVGTADGRMILRPEEDLGAGYDPRTRPWYQEAVANPDRYIVTKPYEDATTHKTVITVAKAIENNGTIVGVSAIDFELDKALSTIFGSAAETEQYLIDTKGNVLLSSDDKFLKNGVNIAGEQSWSKIQSNAKSPLLKREGYAFR